MACGGTDVRKVYTQAELDAAIADPAPLRIWVCGTGRFVVSASAHVEAWESAHVEAWGSAHVEARGSAHVEARESAHVVAWGSAHVVASKLVAVHRHAQTATVEGGVVIEVTRPATAAEWCDYYGVSMVDGVATLYKSVRADYGSSYDPAFSWRPGTEPDAGAIDSRECGVGLHFSPCVSMARQFHDAPDARYLACPVRVADIRVHPNPTYPTKVKAQRVCGPIYEVDRYGQPVAMAVEAVR